MATDHPTVRRVTTETDLPARRAGPLRGPALVLGYAALWVAFTLGGGLVALTLAEAGGGLTGIVLLATVGLGAVAAGPTVARRAMTALLARVA